MKCRVWTFKYRTIEPVGEKDKRLFDHFFPNNVHGPGVSDCPENWEFLEDMCRRHGETLERVADR